MSTPIITIVGRPNVGKSTLFNRLAGRRAAITGDQPGITRDRNTLDVNYGPYSFILIDTGGFEPETKDYIPRKMREQSQLAVEEADAILFVVDRIDGWNPQDRQIYDYLRKSSKPVYLLINKVDHHQHEIDIAEFYESGAGQLFPVSAEHNQGLNAVLEAVAQDVPSLQSKEKENTDSDELRLAIIGRPNAGKSSLINSFLRREQRIVHDSPGTTRDPVDSLIQYKGRQIRLIDTAGIRQKGRVSVLIDKYSMVAAIRSIDRAHAVLLIIDSHEGAVEQDARIASYALEKGKAIILAANKWDLVAEKEENMKTVTKQIRDELYFLEHCPLIFVSAVKGQRINKLFDKALEVHEIQKRRIATADVNRVLSIITTRHEPPGKGGKRLKLYYGTQVSRIPPTFTLKTNTHRKVPASYERFIINQFRYYFGFEGSPIRIKWDHNHNTVKDKI